MRRYKLDEKEFSEINITPLTDIMLVLLIIFMITSPLLISGMFQVKLPQSINSDTEVNKGVEVFLSDKGEISVDNKKLMLGELPGFLKVEFKQRNNYEVIVKADKNVLHGSFINLLDKIKEAGATKLLIATSKVETK